MCHSSSTPGEDKDMSKVLEKHVAKRAEEFSHMNFEKLRARAHRVKFDDNGAILLDRNNPSHREWYEDNEDR